MGVTQTLGTLSRNCEGLAAAQYKNSLGPGRFRKIEPDLLVNMTPERNWVGSAPVARTLGELDSEIEEGQALKALAEAKRRRTYRDL